jgi:hypothetical protein
MTTRFPLPDPPQRISAIRHVVYEYGNLISAAHWSMHGQAPWRTHADDAFILGYRKLDDFLMADKRTVSGGRELDDILALDYLPPHASRSWDLPIWKAEWKRPMNKQLAHITYDRDKEWVHWKWVPQLENELRTAWSKFLGAIVDASFRQEFDAQLMECQSKPGFKSLPL